MAHSIVRIMHIINISFTKRVQHSMLLNQLMQLSPKMGGNWLPSLTWMFLTDVQTPRRNLISNRFLLGIVRAWDAMKTFLHKQMPDT